MWSWSVVKIPEPWLTHVLESQSEAPVYKHEEAENSSCSLRDSKQTVNRWVGTESMMSPC